jgi:hypothetical protein
VRVSEETAGGKTEYVLEKMIRQIGIAYAYDAFSGSASTLIDCTLDLEPWTLSLKP